MTDPREEELLRMARYSAKRERMCFEKRSHSEEDAKRRAHDLGRRAYPCPVCKSWHLTSLKVKA